jgi:hypothetical protein
MQRYGVAAGEDVDQPALDGDQQEDRDQDDKGVLSMTLPKSPEAQIKEQEVTADAAPARRPAPR